VTSEQTKEWLKVSHSPSGTMVRVSLVEGNLAASWTVKSYASTIKPAVLEARKGARKALVDLREAMAESEEVSA
jgi:hypothetical protein